MKSWYIGALLSVTLCGCIAFSSWEHLTFPMLISISGLLCTSWGLYNNGYGDATKKNLEMYR